MDYSGPGTMSCPWSGANRTDFPPPFLLLYSYYTTFIPRIPNTRSAPHSPAVGQASITTLLIKKFFMGVKKFNVTAVPVVLRMGATFFTLLSVFGHEIRHRQPLSPPFVHHRGQRQGRGARLLHAERQAVRPRARCPGKSAHGGSGDAPLTLRSGGSALAGPGG